MSMQTRLRYRPRTGKEEDEREDPVVAEHICNASSGERERVEQSLDSLLKTNDCTVDDSACSDEGGDREGSSSGLTCGAAGDDAPTQRPFLVLLGGPSGTGKSTLAPLVAHLLMKKFRRRSAASLPGEQRCKDEVCPSEDASADGCSAPSDIGLEDGCVVVSSDHTRKIIRALSESRSALLFHSTYELQAVVQQQLASLREGQYSAKEGDSRCRGAKSSDASSGDTEETEQETAECPGTARSSKAGGEGRHENVEKIRRQIEENLRPFRAWFPERCPSCQEPYPCSAVAGLLQQSILLQQTILGPTIDGLMRGRRGTRKRSAASDEGNQSVRGGEDSKGNSDANASPLKLVVVEGVHLTPGFVRRLQNRYGRRCLSFAMYVHSKEEHAARLRHRKDDGCQAGVRPTGSEKPYQPDPMPASQPSHSADARPSCDMAAETKGGKGGNEPSIGRGVGHGESAAEETGVLSTVCDKEKGGRTEPTGEQTVNTGSRRNRSGDRGDSLTAKENKYVRNLCNIRCLQIYLCLAAQSSAAGLPPAGSEQQAIEAVCKRFASEANNVTTVDKAYIGDERDDLVDLDCPRSWGQGGSYTVLNRDLHGSLEFMRSVFVSLGIHV